MTFILETIRLGLTNLRLHLLRSFLTALGIIFGVAAVIAMVSIGEGSKREALLQIEQLGALNIIVRSQKPAEETQQGGGQNKGFISKYGLTREDLDVIKKNFPNATAIVPIKEVGGQILREDRKQISQSFGVMPQFKEVARLKVARGRYITATDLDTRAMVAVIGREVAKEMFPFDDPLGNTIRIDTKAFTIIGVLEPVGLSGGSGAALIGRDLNLDLHIPITTAKVAFGDTVFRRSSGSFQANEVQISEIYIRVLSRDRVVRDAARLKRLMAVRHKNMADIGMIVPYELLENARRTAITYSAILASIAGISLLVGGIGIMNIMLATVTERTREIGIRRALGATRKHIIWQFLVETGVLSAIGGLTGVLLGISLSFGFSWGVPRLITLPVIGRFIPADLSLPTQITNWSIVLAFGVALVTGLVFGIYPALKAARQDPIEALRHD